MDERKLNPAEKAADDLKAVDAQAAKTKDNTENVKEKEEKAEGFYSRSGRNDSEKTEKGGLWGSLNKKGPIIGIILSLFGFGSLSFFGMTTELVAWKENLYSMFGQSSAVINRRSNFMMRTMLRTNRGVSNTIFGNMKFKINNKLAKKLGDNGIDYQEVDGVDGKKLRLLVFEDADGRITPVVADQNDLNRVPSEIDIGDGRKLVFSEPPTTLTEAKYKNKQFSVSFDNATLTLTGKVAGWFDDMADNMYRRIIGSNARNQTDIDDPDEEKVRNRLLGNASDGMDNDDVEVEDADNQYARKANGEIEYDSEGRPVLKDVSDTGQTYRQIEAEDGSQRTNSPDVDTVRNSLSAKAKKAAMMGASAGCMILKGVGAISAAVGAVQTLNVIQRASKYLELADKIKAGDADEVVNIATSDLNEWKATEMYNINGEPEMVEGSVTTSDGWNQVFSSTNLIDENSPSALAVNRELANKNAIRNIVGNIGGIDFGRTGDGGALTSLAGAVGGFGASIAAFRACNALQGVMGAVSLAADFASFFTFGLSKLVKDTIRGAIQGAALSIAMITIGTIISAVTPIIANWFAETLEDVFLGENGGFALLSGAQSIMNSNLQMSTGRYATDANAKEVFALTRDVEREWAAYERATKSPFDLTSKYTFFGSMYNSILPIINTSSNAVTATISSAASLMRSSTLALVSPSASAAADVDKFANSLASEGNCGYLQAVGVAGDFACNKYTGAYVAELTSEDPETVYENMQRYGSFDGEYSDGNPKVRVDSDYAKYIVACVTSDTQPGTMSGVVQGFLNRLSAPTDSMVANGLVNFGMNFVPFEGALDIAQGIEAESDIKWNSGLACTGETNDPVLNEKVKNFSMYNLDQRVLKDMGFIEENSTVAFLEDYYYKENPLDDSFEGRIARISGMSKDEVEDTLALIEYYQFLNEYDAGERYAFGAPVVEAEDRIWFNNDNKLANRYFILSNEISFYDVRNRSFAV